MKLINATQMMFEESEAYISAQAQITDKVTWDINYVVHTKLQQLLANAPEVDAVEVVRCKDCKYYAPLIAGEEICFCDLREMTTYDDDFCSRGKRGKKDDD